jgi:lysozyme family protein
LIVFIFQEAMSEFVNNVKWIQRALGETPDGVFGPRTAQAVMTRLSAEDGVERTDEPVALDERTRMNIQTLDAKARERFEELALLGKATAGSLGCEYVMISGNRTWEEQEGARHRGLW